MRDKFYIHEKLVVNVPYQGVLVLLANSHNCHERIGETGIIVQILEDRLKYHGVQTIKELQVKQVS